MTSGAHLVFLDPLGAQNSRRLSKLVRIYGENPVANKSEDIYAYLAVEGHKTHAPERRQYLVTRRLGQLDAQATPALDNAIAEAITLA